MKKLYLILYTNDSEPDFMHVIADNNNKAKIGFEKEIRSRYSSNKNETLENIGIDILDTYLVDMVWGYNITLTKGQAS